MRQTERLGNRDARFPVARAAAGVGEGEDANMPRIINVKDQIGETLENVFSNKSAMLARITFRVLPYLSKGRSKLQLKIRS